jgi:hypothetical protein
MRRARHDPARGAQVDRAESVIRLNIARACSGDRTNGAKWRWIAPGVVGPHAPQHVHPGVREHAGASVVLAGTRASVLAAAREELDPSGDRVAVRAGAITAREHAHDLVRFTLDRFGRLDALVNSTAIFRPVPFLEQTEAHFEEPLGSILRRRSG